MKLSLRPVETRASFSGGMRRPTGKLRARPRPDFDRCQDFRSLPRSFSTNDWLVFHLVTCTIPLVGSPYPKNPPQAALLGRIRSDPMVSDGFAPCSAQDTQLVRVLFDHAAGSRWCWVGCGPWLPCALVYLSRFSCYRGISYLGDPCDQLEPYSQCLQTSPWTCALHSDGRISQLRETQAYP